MIRIAPFPLALTFCAAVLMPVGGSLTSPAHAAEIDVWIGTASSQLSQGIYHCTLNTDNGKLSPARLVAEASGPGFLAMHPTLPVLYAVGTLDGTPSVIAYTIGKDPQGKAALTQIGSLPIGDGGGTHLAVDATGTTLLTAQYGGGSVAVFALADDGSLDRRTQLIKHEGGSRVVQGRQEAPHTHWVGFSPDNRFAFAPDLGLDQVVIYRVDADKSELTPHGHADVPPGGGPRHMKFHPSGKWAYVLNELDLTVSVFDYDAKAGTMTRKQTVQTVSRRALNREQFVSASEIRVHPSGKFVYSANRGHDTITVFEVDADSGELNSVQRANVRGATPRNFNLDPSAKWLLAAGQDSHSLASFVVEEAGTLQFNRSVIHVPSPICVLFQPE